MIDDGLINKVCGCGLLFELGLLDNMDNLLGSCLLIPVLLWTCGLDAAAFIWIFFTCRISLVVDLPIVSLGKAVTKFAFLILSFYFYSLFLIGVG